MNTPQPRMPIEDFAKYLIVNATKSELKLCKHLTQMGYNFEFQKIKRPFILDFYFPDSKKAIELDGKAFHKKSYDDSRDLFLANSGIKVHRIKSYRVFKDIHNVLREIEWFLNLPTSTSLKQ